MSIIANAQTGYRGLEIYSFCINPYSSSDRTATFSLSVQTKESKSKWSVCSVDSKNNELSICVKPFPVKWDFFLSVTINGQTTLYTKADLKDLSIQDINLFEEKAENDVLYRLYTPMQKNPRPLLLFLHGGGECGYDNRRQLTDIYGALKLAKAYPDCYIMAPQAPGTFEEMLPDPSKIFRNSFLKSNLPENYGWHRRYLASICDLIRSMASEGKVDSNRIYVTGMSLGGAGTLRILSVGSGLFAAAAPICPTMTLETYGILSSLSNTKIWVSSAYADHTLYRHKYIIDGILKLRDRGNKEAFLTLYAPEEMEKYGFSSDPGMSLEDKLSDNHYSWALTYQNEYGIMDWLMSQHT